MHSRVQALPRSSRTLYWFAVAVAAATIPGCSNSKPESPLASQSSRTQGANGELRYPARWWEPVSKEGAPDWEILPQEAQPGEVILSKRQADLGLLSN